MNRTVKGPFRVGRSVGRTIYRQVGDEASEQDELIGVMDTRELAARAVECMNALEGWDEPLDGVKITAAKDETVNHTVHVRIDESVPCQYCDAEIEAVHVCPKQLKPMFREILMELLADEDKP